MAKNICTFCGKPSNAKIESVGGYHVPADHISCQVEILADEVVNSNADHSDSDWTKDEIDW